MISALKLFANVQKEEIFIEVVYAGIKESSRRKEGAGFEAVHRGGRPRVWQVIGSAPCGEGVGGAKVQLG